MSVLKERARLLHRALRYRYKLDPDEIRHTRRLVPPGGCVIDLGAHKGGYTYWIAKAVGAEGRVLAVEAQQRLAERLGVMFAGRPQVDPIWAAVAPVDGEIELSVRADGSSHGASIKGFGDEADSPTVKVPGLCIPTLAERAGRRVDFIKCDVEGAEVDVFAAAGEVLERDRPSALVECETRHASEGAGDPIAALAEIFTSRGYAAHCIFGRELVPIAEFDAARHQIYGRRPYGNNFLFTHPDRAG